MVGTRTSKVGRLEGLPSVRRLGDGPVESEDDDSGDDADAGRRGWSTSRTGAKNPDRTVERVRQTAERSSSHRVTMLSDRRCAYVSGCTQTHVPSCRRRYDLTALQLDCCSPLPEIYSLPNLTTCTVGKSPARWLKGSGIPFGLYVARMALIVCQRLAECGLRYG